MRNLEREIGTLCRKVARQVAESRRTASPRRTSISEPRVRELLGRPRFHLGDQAAHARSPAWRPAWPGRRSAATCSSSRPPRCRARASSTITGQLGDVMRESAQAALSYVRSHLARARARARRRRGSPSTTSTSTCPRARCRRTGPSAGITMATALVSLLTGRPVRDDVAMTGEITLTGQVLPIGGLKEKALAAQRNGVAHRHRPRAQRARHRGHPRAPARRPRVRLRRGDRRGARAWRSRRRRRPTAAGARVQPHRAGYRIGTGQQATSGDRGMAAKKQAAKARSAAARGPAPMFSASSRTPNCVRTCASPSRTPRRPTAG